MFNTIDFGHFKHSYSLGSPEMTANLLTMKFCHTVAAANKYYVKPENGHRNIKGLFTHHASCGNQT